MKKDNLKEKITEILEPLSPRLIDIDTTKWATQDEYLGYITNQILQLFEKEKWLKLKTNECFVNIELLKKQWTEDLLKILPKEKEEYTELTPYLRKYNKENGYPEDLQAPIEENQGYNQCLADIKKKLCLPK